MNRVVEDGKERVEMETMKVPKEVGMNRLPHRHIETSTEKPVIRVRVKEMIQYAKMREEIRREMLKEIETLNRFLRLKRYTEEEIELPKK